MAIPIHYDCDTGQDDAVALLYALGSQNIDVKSISVVGGNVDVEQCARNTLQILELAGRADIPVYIGSNQPLSRNLRSLPEVFGVTGMAGAEDMPAPSASPFYITQDKTLGDICTTQVCVGTAPLTNFAKEIMRNPNFSSQIDNLVLMGGCPLPEPVRGRMGNFIADGASDFAEYNFAVDPEAAKIVLKAGFKKITMIGLNITRQVLYNGKIEKELLSKGGRSAHRAAQILSTVGQDDVDDYGCLRQFPDDPVRALHDVVAMVYLDAPDIFVLKPYPIRICIEEAAGQTIIDSVSPDCGEVFVAVEIDSQRFYEKFVETLCSLS